MWKSCFRSSRLKTNVFEKLLNSFSCISFMKLFGLSVFYINFCYFSNNPVFQNFNWSNMFFDQLKIPCFSRIGLVGSIGTWLVLEWSNFKRNEKKEKKKKKKKLFHLMCSSLFEIFFFPFRPFLSRPIQSKFFLSFSSSNLQGFLSLSIGKT